MRFVAIGVVTSALSGLVAGCSSGSPGSIDSPGSTDSIGSPRQDSGQTGSLEPDDEDETCSVASDCDERAAEELRQFTSPKTNPVHFDGAECREVGVANQSSGAGCACHVSGEGSLNVGPVGLDCYVRGRAGDCLLASDEFSGCDLTDDASCDAVCADIEQRYADDAAHTFEGAVLYAGCEEQRCQTVLQLDDRCVADGSYWRGRNYDCSLGAEAILAAEHEARTLPEQEELPDDRELLQVLGTSGFVSLTVTRSYSGTGASPAGFFADAQFADVGETSTSGGEIIDPLEGVDDCGVFRPSGGGVRGKNSYLDATDVQLLDGDVSRPLVENAPGSRIPSYFLYLTPESVEPRYGERYGVHVSGGSFGAAFDSADGLRLPQDLNITELMATPHVEQQDLVLTWTGQGAQPLYLNVIVRKGLEGFFDRTELRCVMKDDGAFTIPASVLQAMPTGLATATFERADRRIVKSGARSLVLQGAVEVQHTFAFGPVCDGTATMDACMANAEQIRAAYTDCDETPPSLAELCPDFLATACDMCPEYFECVAKVTRCTDEGFVSPLGCTCPG